MAIKAQVPLVPVTIVGTYELLPIHVYHLRPRALFVVLGEPIPTAGLTSKDADRLTQRLRDVITQTYFQYGAGAYPSAEVSARQERT
jgi:1-acyl-sn-glycerol-3-phosphate acyltransferase